GCASTAAEKSANSERVGRSAYRSPSGRLRRFDLQAVVDHQRGGTSSMSSLAATFQEGILERRFRFAAHGTTFARDTMAGLTTFIVMSYIIFLNPIILTSVKPKVGPPLAFEGVVTATCVVAAVMTILMGLYTNKAYALAPGLGIN